MPHLRPKLCQAASPVGTDHIEDILRSGQLDQLKSGVRAYQCGAGHLILSAPENSKRKRHRVGTPPSDSAEETD